MDLQTETNNLPTTRNAAREESTAVSDIQGTVTHLTRNLNDSMCNAVCAGRLHIDEIHNPTVGALTPDPSSAPKDGAGAGGN